MGEIGVEGGRIALLEAFNSTTSSLTDADEELLAESLGWVQS